MAITPSNRLARRFYQTSNNIITEISNKQFPTKDGRLFGFEYDEGVYTQAPDGDLSFCFPYIDLLCKAKKYDKDGFETDTEENVNVYLYLNDYAQEGDKATGEGNLPSVQCTSNLHDDGCRTFAERHVKEWKQAAADMLLSGINVDVIRDVFPKYFVKSSNFKDEDGKPNFWVYAYRELELTQKSLLMWQMGTSSTYITDESYMELTYDQRKSYRLRPETIEYPQHITNKDFSNLKDKEQLYYTDWTHTVQKKQTVYVTRTSSSEGTTLVFLNDAGVDAILKPYAEEAARAASDRILSSGNLETNTLSFTEAETRAVDRNAWWNEDDSQPTRGETDEENNDVTEEGGR